MVKGLIIRFLYEHGAKILNSVFKAYKESVKHAPKGGQQQQQQQQNKNEQGGFGGFSFNKLMITPMTKEEALKILNIKESDATAEKVMEQFEKYFEANDPKKGGSFYLQNKIYYAKELLMEKYPKDSNKSKFNPDSSGKPDKSEEKEEEDPVDKMKNKNI